ncbi:NAD(P)-binding protein [Durotheca rogersii]|uniref:NAD(P)-binding protein n=1 Tax=Durotheca rogersii TaxID=419775 RepID=UPI00221E8B38|nr:NAD(P)-binding protein [Durotheca rogersii]KAI5859426.1 NAD(P)-binding protein [Durotheca rogersii]
MAPTVVLITGTTRGIGKGLLELYLARPSHLVVSANRDPDLPASRALSDLPTAEGTSHVFLRIDASQPDHPAQAVAELAARGIDHVDILIGNAAVGLCWPKLSGVKTDDIQKHVDVNVYGFVWLYQAFLLVIKRYKRPTWVTIGSSAAWLTYANAAYGPTKLVGHYYTGTMHWEEPGICAFPIDPGWVQSDLGNRAAGLFGIDAAPITVSDSVNGIVKVVDVAAKETHGGKMWVYDERQVPW